MQCGLAGMIKTLLIGVSTTKRMDSFQFRPNSCGVARFSNFEQRLQRPCW